MSEEPTIPPSAAARDAMRTLHTAAPEAARSVQAYLDALEQRVLLLSNDDAFRAYLLGQAQQTGAVLQLLQRIDGSILAQLAQAKAAEAAAALLVAEDRRARAMTATQVLSQPVVLAIVGILSAVATGVLTVITRLLGAA